jgi:iron complex transport system substrate-binding protein
MQLLRLLGLALLLLFAAPADARSVVDATGRTVQVLDRIERVMPAGPPAAVLLYTLAPEKMIGWPHLPGPAAKCLLGPGFADLPQLTPLVRDGKVQTEQIQATPPDVILDYGSTAPRYVDRATIIQEATGIPVLLPDGRLERTPEVYRLLAGMLGTEERAADLATAAARLLTITRERGPARREAGQIRVYYARSADGLTTATAASSLGDVLRLVDLVNVADGAQPGELSHVTRDQVYAWNPDIVVTNNPGFWKVRNGPDRAGFPAVAQGRVYLAPALPFGWIDEPPSVNRLLGLLWAGHTLYPAVYPEDLRAEARDFYRRFYRIELDDEQFEALSQ